MSTKTDREKTAKNTTHQTTGKTANRLINEASPYLLQHAYDPVDWYTWCDQAFEKARNEDKPVFLSIGYSTCHWCHVMARESFVDEKIAAIMNDHFISIKVDREQRPDIDSIYMRAVQAITGSGGWPMSLFLTPDGKPFYAGTYFPPLDRGSMPGFERLLLAIIDAWQNKRNQLLDSSGQIADFLSQEVSVPKSKLSLSMQTSAVKQLSTMFDNHSGGFSTAPKFPQSGFLSMLMGYYHRCQDPTALDMTVKTLEKMAQGGIHDHIGGGFHRYSTDSLWLVPHFEKMLYDQALLARAYIQSYQVTGKNEFADIARGIFDYVLRDMKDENSAFYSAEDADSEGAEGTFYIWDKEEIETILGDDSEFFNACYGVTEDGNFEGKNILHLARPLSETAAKFNIDRDQAQQLIGKSKEKLFAHREKRIRPHRDEKIIAGWNGLMISALAYGGSVLDETKYITAASKAARFVLDNLNTNGRLKRFYGKNGAQELAVLDDYSFLMMGLIDLYRADFNPTWLIEAENLANKMIELFGDEEKGGFYLTGSDSEKLIVRPKDAFDGAIPSGNSYAANALLKLGQITMDHNLTEQGKRTIETFSGQLEQSPISLSEMVIALDFYLGPRREIIIAGEKDSADTNKMINEIRKRFLPGTVVLLHPEGDRKEDIEKIAEYIKPQKTVNGKPAAYICENYTCKQPVTSISELVEMLDGS